MKLATVEERIRDCASPVVLLDVEDTPRLLTQIALYKEIAGRDYNCWIRLPSHIKDADLEIFDVPHDAVLRCQGHDVSTLRGVDLYISSENPFWLPPSDAVSVAIVHSLPDTKGLTPVHAEWLKNRPTLVRRFDYVVLSYDPADYNVTATTLAPYTNRLYPESMLDGRTESIRFIPGGYPKVGWVHSYLKLNDKQKDCVVVAPTNLLHPASMGMRRVEEVVNALVRICDEYTIVLRPYPNDLKDPKVFDRIRALEDEGEGRVIVDRSITGLEFQERAALMVTDTSSAAVTFSFASERPVVFIDKRTVGQVEEDEIGCRVGEIERLNEAIAECGTKQEYWRKKIACVRESRLCNALTAGEYLAGKIDVFLGRGSEPDWLNVPRNGIRGESDQDYVTHCEWLENRWRQGNRRHKFALREIYDHLFERG